MKSIRKPAVVCARQIFNAKAIGCVQIRQLSSSHQSDIPISRTNGSFVEAYKEFLTLAKDHGEGDVHLQRRGKILEISFLNQKKKNAVSGRMMYQLAHIVDDVHKIVAEDDSVIGLAIRGEGMDMFSSGADLEFAGHVINCPSKGALMSNYMTAALNSLRHSGLISVCCLNGTAVGGGAELATVGDFRLMSNQDKKFIQFVHASIGASPGWGGARRLTSIVGRKEAIKLAGSSKRINASEALKIGLVDEIVDIQNESDWITVIEKFLQPYTDQKYSKSVRAIKLSIDSCEHLSPMEGVALETEAFRSRWFSPEHKSVMDKILSK